MNMDDNSMADRLPGFRFHPTEEELLSFYLKKAAMGKKIHSDAIGLLNIYRYDPWELPGLAKIGEREWYFFVPRDKRHGHGGRPNRTTENGFWKATGSDRQIRSSSEPKKVLGLKKTLVFYRGRAPRGTKTDWVMNEYRLPENHPSPKEDIVLCKIYRKATSLKTLEQRAAMEDQSKTNCSLLSSPQSQETPSISYIPEENSTVDSFLFQKESYGPSRTNEEDHMHAVNVIPSAVELGFMDVKLNLRELEVPALSMDPTKDNPWWIALKGMWNLDQCSPLANLLNF